MRTLPVFIIHPSTSIHPSVHHHPFSILEHTASTVTVDSRGTGAVLTQIPMHVPFSGTTKEVPIVQSAPGPFVEGSVGRWVVEQATTAEPGGQRGAKPVVHPHPPAGRAASVQFPNADLPGVPPSMAAHVTEAGGALKVRIFGVKASNFLRRDASRDGSAAGAGGGGEIDR